MKRIKSTVSYVVPHWNFCNSDITTKDSEVSNKTCAFCIKANGGYRCALYDTRLQVYNGLIDKTKACCRATAGFRSEVVVEYHDEPKPIVPPKVLMKETINLYNKTVNQLLSDGYPRQLAEKLATKHILGD